jgi:hypothetical protein
MCSVPEKSIYDFVGTPAIAIPKNLSPNIIRDIEYKNDKVINLIRKADLEYSSHVPTLDLTHYPELHTNLFRNLNIKYYIPELPDPSVVLSYAHAIDPNKDLLLRNLFPELENDVQRGIYPMSLWRLETLRKQYRD